MTPDDAYRAGRYGNSSLPPINLSGAAYSRWQEGRRAAEQAARNPNLGDLLPGERAAEFVMGIPRLLRLALVSAIVVGLGLMLITQDKLRYGYEQRKQIGLILLIIISSLWVGGYLFSLCVPALQRAFDRAFPPARLKKIRNWFLVGLGVTVAGLGLVVWYVIEFKLPQTTHEPAEMQNFLQPVTGVAPPLTQAAPPKLRGNHVRRHRKRRH